MSAEKTVPLKVGDRVPNASIQTESGLKVNLKELIFGKPTVLIFYRGGWCPYCNLHLGELSKIEPDLITLGYQIYAISPDEPEKLKEHKKKGGFTYTLLSDSKMEGAREFGLAFKVDGETVTKYKNEYNIDLEAASGETHHLLPVPSAYVISADGVIRFSYSDPDYKVRVNPQELLTAAELEAKRNQRKRVGV